MKIHGHNFDQQFNCPDLLPIHTNMAMAYIHYYNNLCYLCTSFIGKLKLRSNNLESSPRLDGLCVWYLIFLKSGVSARRHF